MIAKKVILSFLELNKGTILDHSGQFLILIQFILDTIHIILVEFQFAGISAF